MSDKLPIFKRQICGDTAMANIETLTAYLETVKATNPEAYQAVAAGIQGMEKLMAFLDITQGQGFGDNILAIVTTRREVDVLEAIFNTMAQDEAMEQAKNHVHH